MKLIILFCLITLSASLPQWPYRENTEYYGYQNRPNLRSVEDDDEVEVNHKARQDLKVGGSVAVGNFLF
jgi:hypothetical protein